MDTGKHDTVIHTTMPPRVATTATSVAPRHAGFAAGTPHHPSADRRPPPADDINGTRADPGPVEIIRFPLNAMLDPLRADFTSQAHAEGLVLRVTPCPLSIDGDPRHLAQIIRIILWNVLKHSRHGTILIGCHRHGEQLSIEIRETGIGFPRRPLQDIIGNHFLPDTPARDHGRGPDIGLAVAKRLGDLIGCQVVMRGRPGVGSVFVIKVGRFWADPDPPARECAQPWDRMPSPAARASEAGAFASPDAPPVILVVDPDRNTCEGLRRLVGGWGWHVEGFPSSEAFPGAYPAQQPGRRDACILIDADLRGGLGGLDLLRWLGRSDRRLRAIMMGGGGDIPVTVAAMKAGAVDFLQTPVCGQAVLASLTSIDCALERSRAPGAAEAWHETAANSVAGLTPRQRQILALVLAGQASKNIAATLGISQRTVENHRSAIMRKTGARSLPGLTRLALAGRQNGQERHI